MDLFGEDDHAFGGPGGLFAQLAQGFGGGLGPRLPRPAPNTYDAYFRAYSVAMLPGKERENVSYGGKIIMPPSALANLTSLDLESPWMFQLRNPTNTAASTYAGVLEFIAQEGHVHLPHWMMKTLRLEEGDPIRITGAELPKGKLVKLQAQSVHFLEISDHKAVLEQALRHFSALTQGDVIEICYNSIVFGLLVMETQPGGEGISVLDTDLEVDFAPPVGYKEPERPKPPPTANMAKKLNIDVGQSTPGSSRPASALAGTFAAPNARGTAVSKGGEQWESFKGKGETLGGRKTKGKGISHRQVEQVAEGSKIIRTDKHRVVTNNSLEAELTAPAPLNVPHGTLFFGFKYTPYVPPESAPTTSASRSPPLSFSGRGNTLSGTTSGQSVASSSKGKGKEQEPVSWGSGGRTLTSKTSAPPTENRARGAGGATVPVLPNRNPKARERSPSPDIDFGVSDDDDGDEYIDIDSD